MFEKIKCKISQVKKFFPIHQLAPSKDNNIPIGNVTWGSFKSVIPIGRSFGYERGGKRIGRYYIENFLRKYSNDIHGVVLEIADNHYTKKFGGNRVTKSEILHAVSGNPIATLIGDLATGEGVPNNYFNCIILTQTIPFIYDIQNVVETCYHSLKSNGVLLVTVSGISQISRYDMDRWGDYWRFTDASVRTLFGDVFNLENISIESHGNVLIACAFLHGLAVEELTQSELDFNDPDYQVIITIRAIKKTE